MDVIRRIPRLSKEATACTKRPGKHMVAYIERFLLPAQGYLNLVNADSQLTVSQTLAMELLSNANLSQEMFSLVMAILETTARTCTDHTENRILLQKNIYLA